MRLLAFTAGLLFTTSCSEYDLHGAGDAEGADTGGVPSGPGGGGSPSDACDPADAPGAESVPLNEECDVALQTGTFTPVVEWYYGDSSFCGPAAVGQIADTNGSGAIDSDDMPIIVLYQEGAVHALYGDGSGSLWTAYGTYGQDGGFAIGDVDGDRYPDVVTASTSQVCALHGPSGAQLWCTTGLSTSMDRLGYNYPSVADMNGDGQVEVTIGDAILHGGTGALLGRGGRGIGAAPYGGQAGADTYGALSVPVDLDGDGQMELVTGNAAYDINGGTVWSNTGLDGLVAVADFDLDGQGEIVKTTGNAVVGMESDGSEVWGPITYSGNVGAPAIDDLDGDGVPELVFAAQNALIAMEWGGSTMWSARIEDASGAAGPVLFDFEMDGYPEVLYADETSIQFFSGLDGTVKYNSPEHSSYTILETPIVADVDGDDQVEIVLGHCGMGGGGGFNDYGAMHVFGDADQTWPPGRKIWNQHAYHITNVEDLGGVPSEVTQNWSLYNSFRSGDVGRPPSEYWDLRAEILDVCEDECGAGTVYVSARVNNAGNIDAPRDVPVTLRADPSGPVIATARTSEPIPSGSTGEVLYFELDAADIEGLRPVVTADEQPDGGGSFYECDEDNNVDTWLDAVCD